MLTSGQLREMFPNNSIPDHFTGPSKRRTAVCLFGVPDPVATEQLFQEQVMLNRANMLSKWNIDIFASEHSTPATGLRKETINAISANLRLDVERGRADKRRESAMDDCNNQLGESRSGEVKDVQECALQRPARCYGILAGRVRRSSQSQTQKKLTDFWMKTKSSNHSRKAVLAKTEELKN